MVQKSEFERNIRTVFGEQGQHWLDELPQCIDRYAEQWKLTDLKPVANLTYHYVMIGQVLGQQAPVVLKLGMPSAELSREIECLAHYDGVGMPALLASDVENGAMLLERIMPGTTLASYFPQDEEAALAITSSTIQKLQSINMPIDFGIFPTIETWHASLITAKPSNILPEYLLASARQLSDELIATQTTQVLLHGDLHHDNLLLGLNNQWLAIDPKGVVGDPIYEVGAFIRNPVIELRKQSNLQSILHRRVMAFAEYLSFDHVRITQWSFVQAVLAACWSMEENNLAHANHFIECAKYLEHC